MYSLLFMYVHGLMSYARLIADYPILFSVRSTVIILPYRIFLFGLFLIKNEQILKINNFALLFQDERTSNQVRDYLELGSSKLLARMYNKALGEKHGFLPDDEIKPREPKNKGIGKSSTKSAPLVNVQMEIKVGNALMHRIYKISLVGCPKKNMNFSKSAYGHFFPFSQVP